MPLKVTCTCGKKLVAGDHLAGKRTKCPYCGSFLTIPIKEKPEKTVETTEATKSSNSKPEPPSETVSHVPETEYALSSAVWVAPSGAPAPAPPPKEEYGLQAAAPRVVVTPFTAVPADSVVNTCPECGKTMPENAVLCVGCGFDLRSGKKLGTRSLEEDGRDRAPRRPKPDRR